jgi:Tol biopolymer transport system component
MCPRTENGVEASEAENDKWALYRIPVRGGKPQKLGMEMYAQSLSAHPDGKRIAFSAVSNKDSGGVWVMENFLPTTAVAKPEPKMTLRRVGDWGTIWGKISPDGKYLCDLCLSDPNNALMVRELATGKEHLLVHKVNEGDYIRGASPVISPDSKTVAYRWHDGQEKTFQLQLINLDGSQRRTIQSGENIIPEDWSPDGKRLLALRLDQPQWSENIQFEFVWVSVKDGSVQSITEVPKGRLLVLGGEVALSPDGRFIAYDVEFPQPDGTSKYTIFLFSIEDSREVRIEHPAQEWLLGWTPNGKYIFFVSDRSGERDGWLLPVADGKPQGRARLVCPNIGRISARAGFTRSGDYYYGTRWVVGNVHTVGVDLKEGRALSGCEPVHPGLYGCPAWSPDGQYLAYYAEGPKNIRIRSLATGEERVLEPNLPTIRWFTWSPDGRSLVASSFWVRWIQKPTARRVYQIDIKTGQSSVLMETDVGRIVRAELSPDQKSVFYTTRGSLLLRNLETGREKKISEFQPASRNCWDLSPDGKRLVIADADPNSSCQLKIISVKGEQLVELLPQDWDPPHEVYPWFRSVAWAPDGRSVLLSILKDYHHAVLWQISAKGGQPRQIFATEKLGYWPSGFCVHPDGKLIAFATTDVQDAGLWLMENFLPAGE